MKLFRQVSCARALCLLLITWFVLLIIIISFFHRDPLANVSSQQITTAMEKLSIIQKRQNEMTNFLMDFSYSLNENERDKFLKELNRITNSNILHFEPSTEYELLRRRLYRNVLQMQYYIESHSKSISTALSPTDSIANQLNTIVNTVAEHQRSLLNDIDSLTVVDGYSDWRKKEFNKLSDLVQRRLEYLQNPKNCSSARKLVCDLNKGCGYGCQLHHAIYCLIVAYGTERTLILKSRNWRYAHSGWETVFQPISQTCLSPSGISMSPWPGNENVQVISLPIIDSLSPRPPFLPLSVPKDLADKMIKVHGDPIVWWIGQFLKYLLRPQEKTRKLFENYGTKMNFKKPIVGVHIRRTDKVGTEAAFHSLDEYMTHVEKFYQLLHSRKPVDKKRIYIATDDPKVFKEARAKYSDYDIIGDISISKTASIGNRYSESSLTGVITDIHFLSQTDFIVCTFSSQVCRVAYEIMNYLNVDAADKFYSLDDIYYYGGQKARYQVAVISHKPSSSHEIELAVGDILTVAGNHWNGYTKGTNSRTYKTGMYPSFKVIPKVETADFPKYSQVPLEITES